MWELVIKKVLRLEGQSADCIVSLHCRTSITPSLLNPPPQPTSASREDRAWPSSQVNNWLHDRLKEEETQKGEQRIRQTAALLRCGVIDMNMQQHRFQRF